MKCCRREHLRFPAPEVLSGIQAFVPVLQEGAPDHHLRSTSSPPAASTNLYNVRRNLTLRLLPPFTVHSQVYYIETYTIQLASEVTPELLHDHLR